MVKLLALMGVCLPLAFGQSGVVKSEGQVIPGVTVKATQGDRVLLTVTDASGAFHFDKMTPGAWTVEADMFGFDHLRREVQIGANPTRIDLTLQLRGTGQISQRAQPEGANGAPGGAGEFGLQISAADAAPVGDNLAPVASADGSNDSFLVNGTVSRGLETNSSDFAGGPGFGPGGFGPGGFGPGGPGAPGGPGGAPANFEGQGGPVPGGPGGGGPGPGGGRGGFGGGRGGGFGGGGFGGGRGGFGGRGPGGRGGPGRGRGRVGGFIGNRARQGNNQIRLQAFYTLRNSVLDAKPFALNGQEAPKPAYAQNRFGFNLGGPVKIPKLFDMSSKANFFVNYTGNLLRNPFDSTAILPTPAERTGDFSAAHNIIYDPRSGSPFPNNQIPLTRIDPIATGLLPYIPLPNQSGALQNYRFITSVPANSQNLNTRFNYTFNRSNRLNFTFNLQNRDGLNAQTYGFTDDATGRGMNYNLSWNHNFGARAFQNLTFGFNRNRSSTVPYFAYGTDVASMLGIQGTSPDPRNYGPPNLSFTNYGSLTDGSPVTSAVQSFTIGDSISFNRGKHNISVGGNFGKSLTNTITDSNGRGTFTFSGLATSGFDANGLPLTGTGWDLADFLLGLPQSSSIRYGASSQYFRSINYSAFGQDDWRISNSFSANLGLRYEYFSPIKEKYGRLANLDIAPGFTAAAVVTPGATGPYTGTFPDALINPDRNNFAPRIGIAWRPFSRHRLLIRAGYGWYYNQGVYNQFANRLAAQPPFATSSTVTTSLADPLTLATGLTVTPTGKTITNTYAVDRFYRDAYAQTWNFSLQQDIPGGMIMQAEYTGTKGTRLDVQLAPNTAPPGSSPLTSEQMLQIANAVGFTYDTPVGNSTYHAGQLRVIRRFRNDMSFNLQYTFSKAIDDSSTLGGTVVQNPLDIAAERALSNFDHRHALTASYQFQSPVGDRNGMFANHALLQKSLKDWTLSGSLTLQTGAPLTAQVLGNLANTGGTGTIGSGRAEATGLPIQSGSGYFNALAFTTPLPGQYGNAGRNTIPGPGLFSMNLSLARTVLLGERRRLEFRVDSNNFLNHVNITGFGTVVNSLTYGLPTAAGAMRSLSATVRFRM
jgi:hypothetical protein